MNENENEIINSNFDTDSTENEMELDLGEDDVDTTDEEDDEVTRLRKENETLTAQKNHWRDKAQKSTKIEPTVKTESNTKSNPTLSIQDQYALNKADVAVEDINDVLDYATFKNVSIAEALKSTGLKAELQEKAEKRTVAQASHSGASKRSNFKLSDDSLLANASKGILPESDSDLNRLQELRLGNRNK